MPLLLYYNQLSVLLLLLHTKQKTPTGWRTTDCSPHSVIRHWLRHIAGERSALRFLFFLSWCLHTKNPTSTLPPLTRLIGILSIPFRMPKPLLSLFRVLGVCLAESTSRNAMASEASALPSFSAQVVADPNIRISAIAFELDNFQVPYKVWHKCYESVRSTQATIESSFG